MSEIFLRKWIKKPSSTSKLDVHSPIMFVSGELLLFLIVLYLAIFNFVEALLYEAWIAQ